LHASKCAILALPSTIGFLNQRTYYDPAIDAANGYQVDELVQIIENLA
jgi:hypothetical protein